MMSIWPESPGNFPLPAVDSAGVPAAIRDTMLVCPYNDPRRRRDPHPRTARRARRRHRRTHAAPRPPPSPASSRASAASPPSDGIPLIFDEVVTGFRFAYGGGQEYYGVVPDLCSLGKVIGGGFPLAAVAGRADIMAHFDKATAGPGGFVPQIGTLSGNPVAAVAGLATLDILRRPGTYQRLFETGNAMREALQRAITDAGLTATVSGEAPMFDAIFVPGPVRDYRDTLGSDQAASRRWNALLRDRGVFKSPGKIYVSTAHTGDDVAQVCEAFADAARAMRA